MSFEEDLPNSSLELPFNKDRHRRFSEVIKTFASKEIDIKSSTYDPESQEAIFDLARFLETADIIENPNFSQSKRTERVIRELEPFLRLKFQALEERVRNWKESRKPLLEKLEKYINSLDRNCKLYSSVRLLACTVDVTGSVGGLLMDKESTWAKYAFTVASACGLCGFMSTFLELGSSKKMLDEIFDGRKEDCKLLTPVVKWFEENRELDRVVQDLFPHGIDMEIAMQIQDDSNEMGEYMKVFQLALVSNATRDAELLKDKDFLYSVKLFSNSDTARLWFNRAIFRRHSFHLDYNRMMLQMEYGQLQSLIFQSIPALPLEQQKLTSLPVAGRIMLNLLTMYDTISDLNSGAKSKYSKKLVKLFNDMKKEEEIVDDALRKMKPRQNVM